MADNYSDQYYSYSGYTPNGHFPQSSGQKSNGNNTTSSQLYYPQYPLVQDPQTGITNTLPAFTVDASQVSQPEKQKQFDESQVSQPAKQKQKRKGGRKPNNDPLPPHLEERRRLRRIRNKDAAAKVREKRIAHTEKLLTAIDKLEKSTKYYENLINQLRSEKESLEFMWNFHNNHRELCPMNSGVRVVDPNQSVDPNQVWQSQYSQLPNDNSSTSAINTSSDGESSVSTSYNQTVNPTLQNQGSLDLDELLNEVSRWPDNDVSLYPQNASTQIENSARQNIMKKVMKNSFPPEYELPDSCYLSLESSTKNTLSSPQQNNGSWQQQVDQLRNNQSPNNTTPGF